MLNVSINYKLFVCVCEIGGIFDDSFVYFEHATSIPNRDYQIHIYLLDDVKIQNLISLYANETFNSFKYV